MTETIDNKGKLVCVTGAAGYIGCHVVRELLARGYRVRATVRNAKSTEKMTYLDKLAAENTNLQILEADLLQENSFDNAIADCDYVCHVASAVKLASKDPQREIVDVALNGTKNVLQSIVKAGTVKRVVITSSIALRPSHHKPCTCNRSSLYQNTLTFEPYFSQ
jgi:dihydroflavonol-4-reductase